MNLKQLIHKHTFYIRWILFKRDYSDINRLYRLYNGGYCTQKTYQKLANKFSKDKIIHKIESNQTLSDKKGQYESIFYYRIEKEAKIGVNFETGEDCAIYSQIKIEHTNPIDYNVFHKEIYRKELAEEAGCNIEYITPISKEEYESGVEKGEVD